MANNLRYLILFACVSVGGGCGRSLATQQTVTGPPPTLKVAKPKLNEKINGAAKTLQVSGTIRREQTGWVPSLVLIKLCSDKAAKTVHSSISVSPAADADGNLGFEQKINLPKVTGKLYLVFVGLSEFESIEPSGERKSVPLKTEPTIIPIELSKP